MNSNRLGALDGLRGLAALYVLAFHFTQPYGLPEAYKLGPWLQKFFDYGYVAVPVFFIISGFLVFGSISKRIVTEIHWRRNFYIRRFFRIFPLYWALILCFYLIGYGDLSILFQNMFFTFAFLGFAPNTIMIFASWSIFVEEVFYFIFPFLYKFCLNIKNSIFIYIFLFLVSRLWLSSFAEWGFDEKTFLVHHFILGNIHHLFAGVVLALWQTRSKESFRFHWSAEVLIVLAFFMPAVMPAIPIEAGSFLLVAGALHHGNYLNRFFSLSAFQFFGRRCYGIYLIHAAWTSSQFAMTKLNQTVSWMTGDPEYAVLVRVVVVAIAVVGLADLSWRLWERPWQKMGEKLTVY